jgi:hypothetical protein
MSPRLSILLALVLALPAGIAAGAERLTDEQVKKLIEDIDEGYKTWKQDLEKQNLDDAVITSAERTVKVKDFLKDFDKAIETYEGRFKNDYAASPEALALLRRGSDVALRNQRQNLPSSSAWSALAAKLDSLARAYGIGFPVESMNVLAARLNDGELAAKVERMDAATKQLQKDYREGGEGQQDDRQADARVPEERDPADPGEGERGSHAAQRRPAGLGRGGPALLGDRQRQGDGREAVDRQRRRARLERDRLRQRGARARLRAEGALGRLAVAPGRGPADERERAEHRPRLVVGVGQRREVVAQHDHHERHHDEGVVLRALLGALAERQVDRPALADRAHHRLLRRDDALPDVVGHDRAERSADVDVGGARREHSRERRSGPHDQQERDRAEGARRHEATSAS